MNKKGFTLIELLAVIVLLAVIALIVTPTITGIIATTKRSADLRSIEGYLSAANNFYSSSLLDEKKKLMLDNKTNVLDQLDVRGNTSANGIITIDNTGKVALRLIYNNKCYIKLSNQSVRDIEVNDNADDCLPKKYTESILNGADPVLSNDMIPVEISADGSTKIADLYSSWYEYNNKKWANIVVVTESTRENYKKSPAGTLVNSSDILGYFVWVPRYKYQLFNTGGQTGTSPQEIKIEFENKDATKSKGTTNGDWLSDPAFKFGDSELNGLWVAKYETTGSADMPTVLPNVRALTNQNVSTQFATSQKLNVTSVYGLNNDSHMAKNSEWGAAAYLSQSKYGRCTDGVCTRISLNNSYHITGSSAGRPGDSKTYGDTVYAYNTNEGVLASTTGNITGIYDMEGGSYEYVMGFLTGNRGGSGFSTLPDSKYYEEYTDNQNVLGDAIFETRGWNGNYNSFVSSSYSWFGRGWQFDMNDDATLGIWGYYDGDGTSCSNSFRIVLVP